jgi:glycosyltransferase involved in cell wall biosynthesis
MYYWRNPCEGAALNSGSGRKMVQGLEYPAADISRWPWQNLPEPLPAGDLASASDWPKISLITPSYNQAKYIEDTIRSVLLQGYPNLEYCVIDGGSSDGSVDVIKKYEPWLARWISEPDEGQTYAIIKGMGLTSGEIVNWLNSDDMLLPGALFSVAEAFKETSADVIVGQDWDFREHISAPEFHFKPSGYAYPDCLRFWTGEFRYHQPCTFFTRPIFERAGGLDKNLHYVMDYDLYCRMLRIPYVKVVYVEDILSGFRLHSGTKTSTQRLNFLMEQRKVSRSHWLAAGINEMEAQDEMDRYSAGVLVHQAAEAVRRGAVKQALKIMGELMHTSPLHGLKYAALLATNKLAAKFK